ncbi:MAG: hypothetical protein K1X89_07525 [Myxococcaceae bacterium]|nr:hypothetical protein [Myxococcaceae bacterium]
MRRLVLLVFLCCACAGQKGALLTAEEQRDHGARVLPAPQPQVFAAASAALRSLGYPQAIEEPGLGLLKTGRKLVRSVVQAGVGEVPVSRQYALHLRATGAGTEVVAEPFLFIGERDVSREPVWQLDGDDGERALWDALFKEIAGLLAPAPAPGL